MPRRQQKGKNAREPTCRSHPAPLFLLPLVSLSSLLLTGYVLFCALPTFVCFVVSPSFVLPTASFLTLLPSSDWLRPLLCFYLPLSAWSPLCPLVLGCGLHLPVSFPVCAFFCSKAGLQLGGCAERTTERPTGVCARCLSCLSLVFSQHSLEHVAVPCATCSTDPLEIIVLLTFS